MAALNKQTTMDNVKDRYNNTKLTMDNVKQIYDSSNNTTYMREYTKITGGKEVNETIEYYDPALYGDKDWEAAPSEDALHRGGKSKHRKGAKSSYVYTGFFDCICGKRLEAVCPRRYKLMLKLHFKQNPNCKNSWDNHNNKNIK